MPRTPSAARELRLYVFIDNEAVTHFDLLGLTVYLVHVPASIPIVDHRMIFGDDGKGGLYVIDFAPRYGKRKRICGPGIIGYSTNPETSAREAILNRRDEEGRGVRGVHWVATTDSVDAQLAQDAKAWYQKGQPPTFIAGFRDCNQFAWAWIAWARFLQDRAPIELPSSRH